LTSQRLQTGRNERLGKLASAGNNLARDALDRRKRGFESRWRRTARTDRQQHLTRVDQSFDEAGRRLRFVLQAEKALCQREERCGKVAAVDCREIAGMERRQSRRVVPVEEMTLVPLQTFERRQHPVEALAQVPGRDVAEVVRSQRRQQAQGDIGGRGPPCELRSAVAFLEVVRRQPCVSLRYERFEVAPGLAGGAPKQRAIVIAEGTFARAPWQTQPVRDGGGGEPQEEKRRGGW
jgi:hypothetical protein